MVSGINPTGVYAIRSHRRRKTISLRIVRGRPLLALLMLTVIAVAGANIRGAYAAQGHSPLPSPVQSPRPIASSPAPAAPSTPVADLGPAAALPQANAVIIYLGEVVSWYH